MAEKSGLDGRLTYDERLYTLAQFPYEEQKQKEALQNFKTLNIGGKPKSQISTEPAVLFYRNKADSLIENRTVAQLIYIRLSLIISLSIYIARRNTWT